MDFAGLVGGCGALRHHVQLTHRIHLVAEQFDAVGGERLHGVDVEYTAAHRKLPAAFHLVLALIAHVGEQARRVLQVQFIA